MKFMVSWQVHPDKRHETFKAFCDMSSGDEDFGGVKLLGRWHDVVNFTGVAICVADDPSALGRWLLNWNDVIDIEAVPVLDDEEARAVGKAHFS